MDKAMGKRAKQSYPPYKQYKDNIIYADDASLLSQQEPPQQTIARLQNYAIPTQKDNSGYNGGKRNYSQEK